MELNTLSSTMRESILKACGFAHFLFRSQAVSLLSCCRGRMVNVIFSSTLAKEMTDYLELRALSASERSVLYDRRILTALDQYLVTCNFRGKELTEELLNIWIFSLIGKSKTVQIKVGTIRNFVKYLNNLGNYSFLPISPKAKSDYIPYIYSDEEIQQIMYCADNLVPQNPNMRSAFFHLKIPMFIRILYGCGTRLEETVALQRKDIDFKNGTLFLRRTKFSKERLIPVHNSLLDILERYCFALGIMNQPDAYLFPGKKSCTHYTSGQMQHWFSKILELADIDQRSKKPNERGTCLHGFRHLFVLKSMQQLEAAGHPADMNDLLLPTYLGHESLIDTDKYMRFSGVQVPESLDAFETFTAGLIPQVEAPYEEE